MISLRLSPWSSSPPLSFLPLQWSSLLSSSLTRSMATVLITGATGGIGREIALKLVEEGKNVYVTGRNQQRLDELLRELQGRRQDGQTVGRFLFDIGRPSKVEEIMTDICAVPFDTVIFNAGVMFPTPRPANEDDLPLMEETLKTNVVGHYIMARHLLEKQTQPIRFVCLSSVTAKTGRLGRRWKTSFNDVQSFFNSSNHFADGWMSYFDSKLAAIVLAQWLNDARENVSAVAVHPGVARTNMVASIPRYQRFFLTPIMWFRTFDGPDVCANNVINATVVQNNFTNRWLNCQVLEDIPTLSDEQKDSFMNFIREVTEPYV